MSIEPSISKFQEPIKRIDRHNLEILASGKISTIFGALFEKQDDYHRQVRLPSPPLLLVDRVTSIDAIPGILGQAKISTESDVTESSWYLHQKRMPMGIMVEAGQADLLLISYMGVDFENKGLRVYRMLGCSLTFHTENLPMPGETISFEIRLTGHAKFANTRLFFFEYDGFLNKQKIISVRNAQAGFFSDEELDMSAGVLWDPSMVKDFGPVGFRKQSKLEPLVYRYKNYFSKNNLLAFSKGELSKCFGEEYSSGQDQLETPTIPSGKLLLIDEVQEFNPAGGPNGCGYLKAIHYISSENWYFMGHFKNDPCMPGTLMLEGCGQALSFYLAAMGFSINRKGWRFAPLPEMEYKISCRGQVIPTAKQLVYEVFVLDIHLEPNPIIFADVLCTADAKKAFHVKNFAYQLVF